MEQLASSSNPQDNASLLRRAVLLWQQAQCVQQTPATEGHPVESALVEQLAANPDCEPLLVGLLEHASPLVVAYALLTLELRDSHALRQLPPLLLERRAAITLAIGSAKIDTTLAELALQMQQRAEPKLHGEFEGSNSAEATTTFTWSVSGAPAGLVPLIRPAATWLDRSIAR